MAAINLASIDTLNERVKAAARSRSQDVRLTMAEAQDLVATVSSVAARHASLLEQIADLQKQLLERSTVVQVDIAGGTF